MSHTDKDLKELKRLRAKPVRPRPEDFERGGHKNVIREALKEFEIAFLEAGDGEEETT